MLSVRRGEARFCARGAGFVGVRGDPARGRAYRARLGRS
jgi:hypothetical protein